MFGMILEGAALAAICSADAFAVSFSYGSNKLKIPFVSTLLIVAVCSAALAGSALLGSVIKDYLPDWLAITVSFLIFFTFGIIRILDSATKTIIKRHNAKNSGDFKKIIKFSMFNFNFILNLYASPEDADINGDKIISPGEAAALAVSLSLDSLAAGLGAAFGSVNTAAVFVSSVVFTSFAICLGFKLGGSLSSKLPFNASWISGAVLVILAFTRMI